jgi:four helix bundle protein
MEVAEEVYAVTKRFPREETFGLAAQLRRAVVSIPSNLAEGHARESTREYLHHISIAQGSAAEAETQLLLAKRLGYLDGSTPDSLFSRIGEIRKMLFGLRNALASAATP